MTKQKENTTGFKPLGDQDWVNLKILACLRKIVPVFACMMILILGIFGTKGKPGIFGVSFEVAMYSALMLLVLVASIVVLFVSWKPSNRAKTLLEFEGKAVLYYLTPQPASADGRTRYTTQSVGPSPLEDLRLRVRADFRHNGVIAIILPFLRGEDAEIHISNGETFSKIKMSQMRLEAIEAHWGSANTKTLVVLIDKQTSSRIDMPISIALERLYINRDLIETCDIGYLWVVSEGKLLVAQSKIKALEAEIAKYKDETARLETDRSRLMGAVIDAVMSLSDFERMHRSWVPVREIGMSLVSVTDAFPPRSPEGQMRITRARVEFEKKRKTT